MSRPGRNDPCPCGSGRKYKQCCLLCAEHSEANRQSVHLSIPMAIHEAIEHHQAGRLPEAEIIYRQILRDEPDHPDALHLLGLLANQTGHGDLAVELIGQAIRVNPFNPMCYINLGNALQAQGKLDAAVNNYREALVHKPDIAEAHYNLGVTIQAQGKLDAAVEHYRKALSLSPNYGEAHNNLALVLQWQGNLGEAIEHYRLALLLQPDYANVHVNMGTAFQYQGKLDAAIESYQKALSLQPDYAIAHYNLGSALNDQGHFDAAVESYYKALAFKPDYAEAHSNLGVVLLAQGKLDEAVEHCYKALSIKPDNAGVYSNLLFIQSYHASLDPHKYLSLARGWEQVCVSAHDRQLARHRTFLRPPLAKRRLRVGYVSGDFRRHPVSYFIEQLFACHDRGRVELFAYSASGIRDAVTERLRALVGQWIPVAGMSDAAVRDRIEADGIDVLVDLSGHTAHNRMGVFARRAAPVQAHYLGYFASTGLTEMDYWIGDEILTPAETDSHFCEQVWRLPRVWVSYKTLAAAPEPDWRPAGDGSVWVGSFNNLGKLTPATLALWARILHALPEGRLLLKNHDLADEGNRQRILDVMVGHGITSDHIELQRESDWENYMAQYNRLDIALDPVGGHGGGTTTCDALWMGVPVIHALGDCATSRFTASMLDAIGHPEWIARSEAEYIAKVVTLARDVEQRKALRSGQRERMAASPLCDAQGLARSLENAYFGMFERWLEQQRDLLPQAQGIS